MEQGRESVSLTITRNGSETMMYLLMHGQMAATHRKKRSNDVALECPEI